jgi:hypothetical protein
MGKASVNGVKTAAARCRWSHCGTFFISVAVIEKLQFKNDRISTLLSRAITMPFVKRLIISP